MHAREAMPPPPRDAASNARDAVRPVRWKISIPCGDRLRRRRLRHSPHSTGAPHPPSLSPCLPSRRISRPPAPAHGQRSAHCHPLTEGDHGPPCPPGQQHATAHHVPLAARWRPPPRGARPEQRGRSPRDLRWADGSSHLARESPPLCAVTRHFTTLARSHPL